MKNTLRKFSSQKKAVATIYSSLLTLIMVISLIILLTSYYFIYSSTIQNQTDITNQRVEEKLAIINTYISGQSLQVVVENTGSIESTVKAIYLKNDGKITFIKDPSAVIKPSEKIEIPMPLPPDANYSIVISTERGTLSTEYFLPNWAKNTYVYDTDNLTIGALTLRFESFEMSIFSSNSWGPWMKGWNPPIGEYLRWRVNITNISNFPLIILDNKTSLALSLSNGPSETAWYVKPFPVSLKANQTQQVIFQVDSPSGDASAKIASSFKNVPSMVFLTFFGTIIDDSGNKIPYGQNIPFEAIIPQ